MGMKSWMIAVLASVLFACNNAAEPEPTDVDKTNVEDSGSTPGSNTVVNDTLPEDAGARVDSVQLDTLHKNNNR